MHSSIVQTGYFHVVKSIPVTYEILVITPFNVVFLKWINGSFSADNCTLVRDFCEYLVG